MLQSSHFDEPQAKGTQIAERRRYVRRPVAGGESVIIVEPGAQIGTWETALLLDLSANGMAIRAPRRLNAGQRLITEFHIPGTDSCARPSCKVVWGDERGKAGVRFVAIEEPAKLQLGQWVQAYDDRSPNSDARPESAPSVEATAQAVLCDLGKLHTNLGLGHYGARPLVEALPRLAEQACLLTHADGVAIALRSDDGGMVCRASMGSAPEVGARLDPDSGLSGECVRTGELVSCSDMTNDPRVHLSAAQGLNARSILIVPVLLQRATIGVLEVYSSQIAAFSSAQVPGLQLIAELISSLVEQGQDEANVIPTEFPKPEPTVSDPGPNAQAVRTPTEQANNQHDEEDWTKAILVAHTESPAQEKATEPGQATELSVSSEGGQGDGREPDPMGPLRNILNQRTPPPAPLLSHLSTGIRYAILGCGLLLVLAGLWVAASRLLPLAKAEYGAAVSSISTRLATARDSAALNSAQTPYVSSAAAQRRAVVQPSPVLPGFSPYPQGEVVLAFNIGTDGGVKDLQVVSGNPILAQADVAAVRKWRYRPFLKDGKPFETATRVTLRFPARGRSSLPVISEQ